MRTLLAVLGRLLGLVLVLAVLAACFAAALVYTSLPDAREEAAIPGLSAPVAITLDSHGIPRIRAETERDAAMALGWLHARDRMAQMEAMRRGAAGRLAEIAGPAALRLDRFSRTLGLLHRAEADVAALSPEARDLLEAYAAGVNARIATVGRLAGPEFLYLEEPEPWRPAHSLLWGKVMGLWLSGNWRREVDRALLAQRLPADRLDDLWPVDAADGRPDLAAAAAGRSGADGLAGSDGLPGAAGLPAAADLAGAADPAGAAHPAGAARHLGAAHLAALRAAIPVFGEDAPLPASASNSWAVVAGRSTTGAPLLANDPHLGFGAPILWYLVRIDLPDGRFRAGASAPGVPGVVIGRNERLAWGFTTTHSDTQDVFVERLVPGDPESYETPEGPRPFTRREEPIAVRGQAAPELLVVRETRHGPVVSGLDAGLAAQEGHVVALAMANLQPQDRTAEALLALNRARSVAEARAAAARWDSPPQTLVVADAGGRIAQYLLGRTPIRRGGDGSLPARGWDGSMDWTGFVPFDALPHVEDPASGLLAAANSRPAPPGQAVFLGREWYGDWRLRRIRELLAARPRHAPADFVAMQNDVVSLFARELLPVLAAVPAPPGLAARAQALLAGWDGAMREEAPQPLVFHAWLRAFGRLALEAGGAPAGTAAGPEFLRLILTDPARGAAWCGPAGCPPLLARALGEAVAELAAAHGADPAAWRWGAVHVASFEHQLLRNVPLLGDLVRRDIPTPGDGETISRGGMRGGGAAPFAHLHGAGLRAVFDLADPEGALAIIATGQSGHPLSDHWDDLLQRWRDGDVVRLGRLPDREAGVIRLTP